MQRSVLFVEGLPAKRARPYIRCLTRRSDTNRGMARPVWRRVFSTFCDLFLRRSRSFIWEMSPNWNGRRTARLSLSLMRLSPRTRAGSGSWRILRSVCSGLLTRSTRSGARSRRPTMGRLDLLVERRETGIEVERLDEPSWLFVSKLCAGQPIEAALDMAGDFNCSVALADHLTLGRFCRFELAALGTSGLSIQRRRKDDP